MVVCHMSVICLSQDVAGGLKGTEESSILGRPGRLGTTTRETHELDFWSVCVGQRSGKIRAFGALP